MKKRFILLPLAIIPLTGCVVEDDFVSVFGEEIRVKVEAVRQAYRQESFGEFKNYQFYKESYSKLVKLNLFYQVNMDNDVYYHQYEDPKEDDGEVFVYSYENQMIAAYHTGLNTGNPQDEEKYYTHFPEHKYENFKIDLKELPYNHFTTYVTEIATMPIEKWKDFEYTFEEEKEGTFYLKIEGKYHEKTTDKFLDSIFELQVEDNKIVYYYSEYIDEGEKTFTKVEYSEEPFEFTPPDLSEYTLKD